MDAYPKYEFERNVHGEIKIEVLHLPLSHCKISFFASQETVDPGHAQGEDLIDPSPKIISALPSVGTTPIRVCDFMIEHPDIDPVLVKSIELAMDYENIDIAMIKVEMRVGKEIDRVKKVVPSRIIDLDE